MLIMILITGLWITPSQVDKKLNFHWDHRDFTDESVSEFYPEETNALDTKKAILKMAAEALEAEYDNGMYRFSVSARWIPGSLLTVSAEDILSVVTDSALDRYMIFDVTYIHGGNKSERQIQLTVETEKKLPVAGQRIINGTVIESGDLVYKWVSIPRDRGQLVTDIDELVGKTIRRTLAEGQPIRHADVVSEYLVEAGDRVTLIFREYGIEVEIEGEARQSGAQDEKIKIYSDETRKRYLGKIMGPGVVKWQGTL